MSLVLDTIGLPPCDDIYEASKMIRARCERDRNVMKHINEVIKLATNIVYGGGDEVASGSNPSINTSRESELEPRMPTNLVMQNPAYKRFSSDYFIGDNRENVETSWEEE